MVKNAKNPKYWSNSNIIVTAFLIICGKYNVKQVFIQIYNMSKDKDIHCFSHDQDEVALTTKGYFWSGWGNQLTKKSICVMPPQDEELPSYIAGVCSDYIGHYK